MEVNKLPYFPELSGAKTSRTITKHFTNAAMYMQRDQFSMLAWLIYQSKADNSFIYSTQLLNRYSAAIKHACDTYGQSGGLKTGIKHLRGVFKDLVGDGYLWPTSHKSTLIINPMLSYNPSYISPEQFSTVARFHENVRVGSLPKNQELIYFADAFMRDVAAKMAKKKKVTK